MLLKFWRKETFNVKKTEYSFIKKNEVDDGSKKTKRC